MIPKRFYTELAGAVASIDDSKEAAEFLENILTPKEYEEVALRLQIFKMLGKGMPQRDIAKKLGVSIGTISRGSRELQYGPKGIHRLFQRLGWSLSA